GPGAHVLAVVFSPTGRPRNGPRDRGSDRDGARRTHSGSQRSGRWCDLSCQPSAGPHARNDQRRTFVTTLRKGTALVVDDEDDVRKVIGDALTETGCSVMTAGDAETALVILDQGGVDL